MSYSCNTLYYVDNDLCVISTCTSICGWDDRNSFYIYVSSHYHSFVVISNGDRLYVNVLYINVKSATFISDAELCLLSPHYTEQHILDFVGLGILTFNSISIFLAIYCVFIPFPIQARCYQAKHDIQELWLK